MINRKKNRIKWDQRFYRICKELATWSSCLSRQIGAVIVKDKRIISTGYNGPPINIPHCGESRSTEDSNLFLALRDAKNDGTLVGNNTTCPRQRLGFKSGEGIELCPALHAEENAILNAAFVGVSTRGSTMYMNCGIPCSKCLEKIQNVGIKEIVCESYQMYDHLSEFLLQHSNFKIRVYE